ncbi:hypothetical protein Asp14428_44270 [Actinoplanes sp. NBRC 14428]|nr:hypothetical protein Asp14428_44270 [Actinoplanes sp. NBRC 14428]
MGTDLPAREPLLRALIDICGPDFARRAGAPDAVAGRRASFVAAPATTQAVADTMGLAAERGLAVIPRGSGSKIDWGTPPPGVDLILDTSRLDGIWNHDVRAMTAEVGAGTPLKAVQAALALRGQRLATDPPSPSATLGGMLALNETGPLRHRFGTAAHQVNHIAYVTSKGEAATSDGENGRPGIAEIDGVILSAQVHVEPLPSARRWVTAPVTSPRDIYELVQETLTRRLTPSAIEVDLSATPPSGVLAVLLEGDPPDVTDRATRLEKAFGPDATTSPSPHPGGAATPSPRPTWPCASRSRPQTSRPRCTPSATSRECPSRSEARPEGERSTRCSRAPSPRKGWKASWTRCEASCWQGAGNAWWWPPPRNRRGAGHGQPPRHVLTAAAAAAAAAARVARGSRGSRGSWLAWLVARVFVRAACARRLCPLPSPRSAAAAAEPPPRPATRQPPPAPTASDRCPAAGRLRPAAGRLRPAAGRRRPCLRPLPRPRARLPRPVDSIPAARPPLPRASRSGALAVTGRYPSPRSPAPRSAVLRRAGGRVAGRFRGLPGSGRGRRRPGGGRGRRARPPRM